MLPQCPDKSIIISGEPEYWYKEKYELLLI